MIKKIDGKIYVEETKERLILLGALLILILVLGYVALTFYQNTILLKSDPFIYGSIKHGFESCSCLDSDGQLINYINQTLSIRASPNYLFSP